MFEIFDFIQESNFWDWRNIDGSRRLCRFIQANWKSDKFQSSAFACKNIFISKFPRRIPFRRSFKAYPRPRKEAYKCSNWVLWTMNLCLPLFCRPGEAFSGQFLQLKAWSSPSVLLDHFGFHSLRWHSAPLGWDLRLVCLVLWWCTTQGSRCAQNLRSVFLSLMGQRERFHRFF